MKRLHRIAKEAAWVGVAQVAAAAAQVVTIKVLTHYLDAAEYGNLAIAISVVGFLGQLVFSPLASGVIRYVAPADEAGALNELRGATTSVFRVATTGVCGAAVVLLSGLALTPWRGWVWTAAAAVAFACASLPYTTYLAVQNALRQRVGMALHQAANEWGKVGAIVLLGMFTTPVPALVLLAYTGVTVASTVSQLSWIRRLTAGRWNRPSTKAAEREWRQRINRYAAPFAATGLITALQLSSDRWALRSFSGAADVGGYAVLYQMGYAPFALIVGALQNLLVPIIFARAGDGSDHRRVTGAIVLVKRAAFASLGCTLLAVVAAATMHRQLFLILTSSRSFLPYSGALPLMVLSGGCAATVQLAALAVLAYGDSGSLILPKTVTGVVGVGLNVIGARVAGVRGVVTADLAYNALLLGWIAWLVSRRPAGGAPAAASPAH